MAKMRPMLLDREITRDPFRGAELRIYDVASRLPEDWHVLYSVAWIDIQPGRPSRDGEADFVFVSPTIGVVVVEVKGGGVGRDADGWYTVDRHGCSHPIKDPVEQARQSKHQLLRSIKATTFNERDRIPMAHAVVFPDLRDSQRVVLPDCPPYLQLTADSLNDLETAITQVAVKANGGSVPALSATMCRRLAEALKPTFQQPGRLSTLAMGHHALFDRLTEQQSGILDAIEHQRLVGLTGPAGSGKTLIGLRHVVKKVEAGANVLAVAAHPTLGIAVPRNVALRNPVDGADAGGVPEHGGDHSG